jgi:hypothetical protein
MARQLIDTIAPGETIQSGGNKLNAMTAELYGTRPHYVTDYGAVGNSNSLSGGGNDDTSAIQAAYTAAAAVGGNPVVIFPGRRAYRITSTISIPAGTQSYGLGGISPIGNFRPTQLKWDGVGFANPASIMFDIAGSDGYASQTQFHNLTLGPVNNHPTGAGIAIRFGSAARPDSGCEIHNVWIQDFKTCGIRFDGGSTNLLIDSGRFDVIDPGYGIYVDLSGGSSFQARITGNTNYVGGSSSNGSGFLFVDGEAATTGAGSFITIDGFHTEINQPLIETYAAGANPYDRRGVIRLGCNTGVAGILHQLCIRGWFNGQSGGLPSYSAIQLTAPSGADTDVSDYVILELDQVNAVNIGTDNAAATGQARIVGGRVPANRIIGTNSVRHGHVSWGHGKSFDPGQDAFQRRHGHVQMRGLTLIPELVADLGGGSAGSIAYVTDATVTTLGTTVVGGGSNKVQVMHNGTAWKITAVVN